MYVQIIYVGQKPSSVISVCAALFTCFLLIIQNHPPEIVPKEATKPRFQNNRRAFGFTWGPHWQLWKTRAQPPWVFSPRCFDHLPVSASCRWQWLGFFSKRYSHFPGMVGSWDMKLTCFWVREAHDWCRIWSVWSQVKKETRQATWWVYWTGV